MKTNIILLIFFISLFQCISCNCNNSTSPCPPCPKNATNTTNCTPAAPPPVTSIVTPTQSSFAPVVPVSGNYITNGDFETGLLTPWKSSGNVTITDKAGQVISGKYSLELVSNDTDGAEIYQTITYAQTNQIYFLACNARTSGIVLYMGIYKNNNVMTSSTTLVRFATPIQFQAGNTIVAFSVYKEQDGFAIVDNIILQANIAPTGITLSSNVAAANGSGVVGFLTTVDDNAINGDTFTYTEQDALGGAFEIVNNLVIINSFNPPPLGNTTTITITSTDLGGLKISQSFNILNNYNPLINGASTLNISLWSVFILCIILY